MILLYVFNIDIQGSNPFLIVTIKNKNKKHFMYSYLYLINSITINYYYYYYYYYFSLSLSLLKMSGNVVPFSCHINYQLYYHVCLYHILSNKYYFKPNTYRIWCIEYLYEVQVALIQQKISFWYKKRVPLMSSWSDSLPHACMVNNSPHFPS